MLFRSADNQNVRRRLSRWEQVQAKWYNIDDTFKFGFFEGFQLVPEFSGGALWATAMRKQEVVDRLLERTPNDGDDKLPEEVIKYCHEITKIASDHFASLQKKLANNEYHLERLQGYKARQEMPKFLEIKVPDIQYFEEDNISRLQRSIQPFLEEEIGRAHV